MPLTTSVIIPVYNAGCFLRECLSGLTRSTLLPTEIIVADDASTDDTLSHATGFDVRILSSPRRSGPAQARNRGVAASSGDLLLFLDADVIPHPDTVRQIVALFESQPELDAVFGSYDDDPRHQGMVSQFRNLLHCFVHQTGQRRACTFWTGCGAVRREVFLEHGGFDASYDIPCMEDVEFGMRLYSRGGQIELIPEIQVKHSKHWTLSNMVRTDIFQRGIPWTRMSLASGGLPETLNLTYRNRCSVAFSGLAVIFLAAAVVERIAAQPYSLDCLIAVLALTLLVIVLNQDFYRFLASRRGLLFALRAIPLHMIFFLCCGVSFVIGWLQHYAALLRGTHPVARLRKRP